MSPSPRLCGERGWGEGSSLHASPVPKFLVSRKTLNTVFRFQNPEISSVLIRAIRLIRGSKSSSGGTDSASSAKRCSSSFPFCRASDHRQAGGVDVVVV